MKVIWKVCVNLSMHVVIIMTLDALHLYFIAIKLNQFVRTFIPCGYQRDCGVSVSHFSHTTEATHPTTGGQTELLDSKCCV